MANVIKTCGGCSEYENVIFGDWMYTITSGTGNKTYTPKNDCTLVFYSSVWANMNITGGNLTSTADGFQVKERNDGGQLQRLGIIPHAKKGETYTINVSGISGAYQGFRMALLWAEVY